MAGNLDDTLRERGKTHGDYADVAATYSELLKVWSSTQQSLASPSALALTMIFMKIARILNGDPNHADHWVDIAGYAKLAADNIENGTHKTH